MKRLGLGVVFLASAVLFFIPGFAAHAAVTQRTAATEMISASQTIGPSSSYTALFGVGLTKTGAETLSSIAFTLTGTVTGSDVAGLRVYGDTSNTGANDDVIDASDTVCGTQTSVNVGSATTISTGTCAIPSSGTGSYDFIIAVSTSSTLVAGKTISFSVAAGTSAYALSSGTVTATALTAANSLNSRPVVSSVAAFTDRIVINFSENMDGASAYNCASYVVNGSALSCGGGPAAPFIEFQGNKATLKNLSLSGMASLAISVSNTIKTTTGTYYLIAYSNSSITVGTLTLPSVSSLSATSGAVGDSITITGTNFGADPGGSHTDADHKVYFSGGFSTTTGPLPPVEAASYTSWSATSITVVVPTGTKGGPVNVLVGGVMSDMNQNSFFDISGSYQVKIYYSADNTTPMPNAYKDNIRIVTAGMKGPIIHKVGDGTMTYANGTPGTFTITGVNSMGMAWANDVTGDHTNSPNVQIDTSAVQTMRLLAATRKISGTITMGSTCAAAGQDKSVVVFAMPAAVDTGSSGFKEINPQFFTTGPTNGQTACQTTYSVAVPINGTYRVEAHIPPDPTVTTVASAGFTAPDAQTVTITDSALTATGKNFTFASSTHRIVGTVAKPSGSFATDEKGMLWVFAYQPQSGKGTGAQVTGSGTFTLNVSKGLWKVGVSGPNMPFPVETEVNVDDTYAIAQPAKGPTLTIAPQSDFIDGYVKDSTGTGLSNVSVSSFREGGPGGGYARTDSQGYYIMYVPVGTGYKVMANSQTYGYLGEQTGVAVTATSHPRVNFNVSSTDNYTISGTVTKDGVALQQAFVFITSGQNGSMKGNGPTDSSGAYSAKVPGGNDYWIHVGLPGKGEVYKASLGTIAGNTTKNVSIAAATLIVRISPASLVGQAFVGVQGSDQGGFSDTSVVTATCTGSGSSCKEYQISIPKPSSGSVTYYVSGGIPGYGPLTQTAVTLDSTGTFTPSNVVTYTLSDFHTVSGSVSGDDATSAYVWASSSGVGGGGQVDSSGNFSINLLNGTYDLGVGKPGYIGNKISITVAGADLTGKNLTLTTASNTIAGKVYLPDGTTIVTNAHVWASNGSGGFADGTTDANGAYSLSVTSGSWTVKAAYDGYNSSATTVTASASGVNITLATLSGFTASKTTSPVTPSDGGIVSGSGFKVDFPQNSLGTDTSAGTVQVSNTSNVPSISSAKIVGTAKDITVTNSSNQSVTTLSGSITITLTASKAELTAQGITTVAGVNKMQISYYDTTADNWVAIPTTVTLNPTSASTFADLDDTLAASLSGTVSHLSTFALSSPVGTVTIDTPTGLTATATNQGVVLAWTAVSGATKYDIYQQLGSTFPYLGQTTLTNYTANGLSVGTSYSFKVSALDDSNNESAATSSVSATPVGGSGLKYYAITTSSGYNGSISPGGGLHFASGSSQEFTITPGSGYQIADVLVDGISVGALGSYTFSDITKNHTISASFSAAAVSTTPSTSAPISAPISPLVAGLLPIANTATTPETQAPPPAPVAPSSSLPAKGIAGIPTNFAFTRSLQYGHRSAHVRYLQAFLKAQGTDIYPQGIVNGNFGPATKAAVTRFQEKYASEVLTPIGLKKGTGKAGPMTLKKIAQLMGR